MTRCYDKRFLKNRVRASSQIHTLMGNYFIGEITNSPPFDVFIFGVGLKLRRHCRQYDNLVSLVLTVCVLGRGRRHPRPPDLGGDSGGRLHRGHEDARVPLGSVRDRLR